MGCYRTTDDWNRDRRIRLNDFCLRSLQVLDAVTSTNRVIVMSNNMIAEGLLLLAAQKRAEIDARVEKFEKEIRDERLAVSRILNEAQNKCTHPTTRTKDDFNYHTREEWVETYCTVCNKLISRK